MTIPPNTSRLFQPLMLTRLTLKVLVTTIDAQWEGMGDVGSARYEPALLPPCPTIRMQLHRDIRYTVYGIWYTRIPVIETIVIKGAVYINIYGLQCTLYAYTWKRACSFFCLGIVTTDGQTTLLASVYLWKYYVLQRQTYCSCVKRYKSIAQGSQGYCCHPYIYIVQESASQFFFDRQSYMTTNMNSVKLFNRMPLLWNSEHPDYKDKTIKKGPGKIQ